MALVTQMDEQKILDLQSRWLEAETLGDVDGLCGLMTETIVMQPPIGDPIVGLVTVQEFLDGSKELIQSVSLSEVAIEMSDDMAIKRARFRTEISGAGTVLGRHLWVLKPSWRVDFVTWSLDRLD